MAGVPRLMVTNRIQATATVLTASSAATASPVARLKDQLRSKTWRSAVGWTIVAGSNDKLDFSDGTTRVATLTAGTYATGALLATEIQTRMNAVSSTCVVSYSGSTFKFTIARTGTLTLKWNTGANKAASVGKCIGFDIAADDTGASTYTADYVAYQSRHWLGADLGSALALQAGIVINHNSGTGGTYTFYGYDAGMGGLFSQVLSGDANIRIAFLSASYSPRYLGLLIEDVQNSLGYSEVGIWFAGPYTQPTVSYAVGFTKAWEELSEVSIAYSGAHFQDEKARRPTWGVSWAEVGEADRAALAAAFALVPAGRCFFFAFDAVTTPADTEYVFVPEGVSEQLTSGLYFNVPVSLSGALG